MLESVYVLLQVVVVSLSLVPTIVFGFIAVPMAAALEGPVVLLGLGLPMRGEPLG